MEIDEKCKQEHFSVAGKNGILLSTERTQERVGGKFLNKDSLEKQADIQEEDLDVSIDPFTKQEVFSLVPISLMLRYLNSIKNWRFQVTGTEVLSSY